MENLIAQGIVDCITTALIPTSSFVFVAMLLLLGVLFCLCSISAKIQKLNELVESEQKEAAIARQYLGVPFKLRNLSAEDKKQC
jgi:cytochrome c biogenesis protein ResB